MLPEFPRAYDAIQKVWNRVLFNAAGFSDPLISQVTVRVQREGHRAFLGESETEYKAQSVSHQWKPEVGKGIPTEEFFGVPLRIGKEMAMKQAKGFYEAMCRNHLRILVLSAKAMGLSLSTYGSKRWRTLIWTSMKTACRGGPNGLCQKKQWLNFELK